MKAREPTPEERRAILAGEMSLKKLWYSEDAYSRLVQQQSTMTPEERSKTRERVLNSLLSARQRPDLRMLSEALSS